MGTPCVETTEGVVDLPGGGYPVRSGLGLPPLHVVSLTEMIQKHQIVLLTQNNQALAILPQHFLEQPKNIQAGKQPFFLPQTLGAFKSKQGVGCFSFLEDTASPCFPWSCHPGSMT